MFVRQAVPHALLAIVPYAAWLAIAPAASLAATAPASPPAYGVAQATPASGPAESAPPASDNASAIGSVLSSDGAAIRGAEVTLSGNGPARTARSDAFGAFTFGSLPSGTYALAVRAPGFNPISAQTVQLTASARTSLDLRLPKLQASSLTVIGSVRANGAQSISSLPAPTLDISTQPYAQQGETRISDILGYELSTTVVPVLGGGLNAPQVVSLRGPDPSETLVDIDGHQVNNGSTGDFDLSLLDPADLTSAQVVYGIAPSSLYGPNTLGGALNVRTLEPTAQAHTLERLTYGTFDTVGETLQATGTADGGSGAGRLGYAFSLHRVTSGGDVDNRLYPDPSAASGASTIGDSMDATSAIAKLRYSLFNGAGFVGISLRDQAVYRDLSSTLSSSQAGGNPDGSTLFSNFSGSAVLSHTAAYDLDVQAPLGRANASGVYPTTAIFRHQTSVADQSVHGPGSGTSPYLYNDRDIIGDDTLEIDHQLPRGHLSARYALTTESLTTDFIPGIVYADASTRGAAPSAVAIANEVVASSGARALFDDGSSEPAGATAVLLTQTQRSLGLLYAADPTSHLHYSFATYYSDYTSFGHSTDPRFGFVWTPQAASAVRISVGSTFQSPQLPTFLVPPTLPAIVDGYVSVGNPKATAERATSYDLGYEHRFNFGTGNFRLGGDLYRTDLHNGVATYLSPTPCAANAPDSKKPSCLSFPVNATQEVYQGVELRGDFAFSKSDALHLGYDIDSVYTKGAPASSLDDVSLGEQSLGVPLHKITVEYDHDRGTGLAYYAGMLYEGEYNETNLQPFATLRAGATMHLPHLDLTLAGTNLTDVYDFRQVRVGGGVPYGNADGNSPTDAIPLAPPTVTFSIAHKM